MAANDDDNTADGRAARAGSVRGNRLLALLPPPVFARLKPHLAPAHLERKEVIFRSHEPVRVVYFPVTAVVSFVARVESGDTLEVGLVGRDGLAGTAVFPGVGSMSCDGIVQIPGFAQRIDADVLRKELLASETLYRSIGCFSQLLLAHSMQIAICNMFHAVEQRCIRWLLSVNDLIAQDDIPLTHELLATMLGVHRPTVTLVIGSLHRAGLIVEERGRVVIRDRAALEASCCECYRMMREERRRLLGY